MHFFVLYKYLSFKGKQKKLNFNLSKFKSFSSTCFRPASVLIVTTIRSPKEVKQTTILNWASKLNVVLYVQYVYVTLNAKMFLTIILSLTTKLRMCEKFNPEKIIIV